MDGHQLSAQSRRTMPICGMHTEGSQSHHRDVSELAL